LIAHPVPPATPPNVSALLAGRHRIQVTGGAGFNCCAEAEGYGGAVVRRLLAGSEALVFNPDKCGYASDITTIEQVLAELGPQGLDAAGQGRHNLLRVDLSDAEATADAAWSKVPTHSAADSALDPELACKYSKADNHAQSSPTAD
jgi:dTDP-glucose 4,6-dehydratase